MMEKSTVVGAGLVGSLLSILLAKRGAKVDMYERRPDMRNTDISAGKSINLALSDRGLRALAKAGLEKEVKEMSIPMHGRLVHDVEGNTNFQPYGKEGQFINSISRGGLNALMMTKAEELGAEIHFEHRCTNIDLYSGQAEFSCNGNPINSNGDRIYGTDGAFSEVRHRLMMTDRFDYSQFYLPHGYKELTIPPAEDGGFRIEKNALHIWPRGSFMLIALPNLDGSFTVTLFLAFEGEHSFENLNSDEAVVDFFNEFFPDAVPHMPTLVEDFNANPSSSLVTVKCSPWNHEDKVLILGDAAHAIVPFYGQGMNAGFEDCDVFEQLAETMWDDKLSMFNQFNELRKPDGDAIADLAIRNFTEMRDLVADERFLLRKRIEKELNKRHPQKWVPLYSMVTFSEIRYSDALNTGLAQDKMFDDILSWEAISSNWESPEVFGMIEKRVGLA